MRYPFVLSKLFSVDASRQRRTLFRDPFLFFLPSSSSFVPPSSSVSTFFSPLFVYLSSRSLFSLLSPAVSPLHLPRRRVTLVASRNDLPGRVSVVARDCDGFQTCTASCFVLCCSFYLQLSMRIPFASTPLFNFSSCLARDALRLRIASYCFAFTYTGGAVTAAAAAAVMMRCCCCRLFLLLLSLLIFAEEAFR